LSIAHSRIARLPACEQFLWNETPRQPVLFDGPVVKKASELEGFLAKVD
jgi:hypothetical protein